jgi:hypothetical protein
VKAPEKFGEGAGKVEALEGVDLAVRGPGPRWLPAVAARRLASSRVRRLDAARRNRLSFSGFDERRPKTGVLPHKVHSASAAASCATSGVR